MKKKYAFISIVALILLLYSLFLSLPTCRAENQTLELKVTMNANIYDIDLENHRILADVWFTVYGFRENATSIYVRFTSIELYEVNCTLKSDYGNGTYSFGGHLDGKYWYLANHGETYPFDYGYIEFYMYNSVEYSINGERYGIPDQITFNVSMDGMFVGLKKVDLDNSWAIQPEKNQQTLKLVRIDAYQQFLVLVPVFFIIGLVAALPSLSRNKETKIRIYMSILVFSPMFLFALHNIIPPRLALSLPEVLTLNILIMSVLLLAFTLPEYKNKKGNCLLEVVGLISSWIIALSLFSWGFLRFSNLIPIQIIMFLLLLLAASSIFAVAYKTSTFKSIKNT